MLDMYSFEKLPNSIIIGGEKYFQYTKLASIQWYLVFGVWLLLIITRSVTQLIGH